MKKDEGVQHFTSELTEILPKLINGIEAVMVDISKRESSRPTDYY